MGRTVRFWGVMAALVLVIGYLSIVWTGYIGSRADKIYEDGYQSSLDEGHSALAADGNGRGMVLLSWAIGLAILWCTGAALGFAAHDKFIAPQ